jgi:hypothetical protein
VRNPYDEIKPGDRGVGTLIAFADESGKKLAELIVGKEVKGQSGLHYVRLPDRDAVYQVKLDASKFSTKFADWIEPDLLKLDAFRIKNVTLRLIGPKEVAPGQFEFNTQDVLPLAYDDRATGDRWSLADAPAGAKLDETKLNDLRNALDDLKIVDVRPKPAALARILAGKGNQVNQLELAEIDRNLRARGFLLTPNGIFPTDGEVVTQLEDGVEYVLYFGGPAPLTADQSDAARKKDEKKDDADTEKTDSEKTDAEKEAEKDGEGKDSKSKGANRYVFVGVSLNKDQVKKPDLKPLPGESLLPKEATAEKATSEKEKTADEEKTGDKEKTPEKPKRATLADSVKELKRLNDEGLISKEEHESQRKQIERENQQAQEKYDSDIKAAEKKIRELNERFADWYYVIDDEVYKKIRLKRTEIVKADEKAKDEKSKDETSKDDNGKASKSEKTK